MKTALFRMGAQEVSPFLSPKDEEPRSVSEQRNNSNDHSNHSDNDAHDIPSESVQTKSSLDQVPADGIAEQSEAFAVAEPKYPIHHRCYAPDPRGHIYLATVKKIRANPRVLAPPVPFNGLQNDGSSPFQYLVHFIGWNSRHDTWVNESDILPDNEDSRLAAEQVRLQLQQKQTKRGKSQKDASNVSEQGKMKKSKKSPKGKRHDVNDTNGTDSHKHGGDETNGCFETKGTFMMPEMGCLPTALQNILVQEHLYFHSHSFGTKQDDIHDNTDAAASSMLVRREHELPATIHVQRILNTFATYMVKRQIKNGGEEHSTHIQEKYEAFAHDVCHLFDALLPNFLLYDFERDQYQRLLQTIRNQQGGTPKCPWSHKSDGEIRSMSSLYSGEYLLRMIVRLPLILEALDQQATSTSQNHQTHPPSLSILSEWKVAYDGQIQNVNNLISELVHFLKKYKRQIFTGKYLKINREKNNVQS